MLKVLLAVSETVPSVIEAIPEVIRDSKDDSLLAYALVGRVDYLVTGDDDLLSLKEVGGLKIVKPSMWRSALMWQDEW